MCASLLASGCHAGGIAAEPAPILPLKRLRLYESGVGYFERSGVADARTDTSLPVPAGHLDDALKTLVVLKNGADDRMHGVEFASSVTKGMARALAGLPVDSEAPISYRDVLDSLKGAPVEVVTRTGRVEGRLVDVHVEEKVEKADAPKKVEPPTSILLLTSAAELRQVNVTDVVSVKPLDATRAARLSAALDALASHGAQDRRLMRLLADRRGPITLGYVAETPLWRTTYRVVLDGNAPMLQGWALLHNDTDETWSHVEIELVNGRPDSFLFPLAAPRYTRRGLATPADELSTIPQLLDKTPDGIWGDHANPSATGLGASGSGGGGGEGTGYGYGSGHGRLVGAHVTRAPMLREGSAIVLARPDAEAQGVEAGALFTYKLGEPLDLSAHASALVPFLSRAVEASPITWVAEPGRPARTAVRFVNTTGQTLPEGPVAFFASGGFAGEATLDRLKPGERRVVEYGADLDVALEARDLATSESVTNVRFTNDELVQSYVKTTRAVYGIENRSSKSRTVCLALSQIARGAQVTGADRADDEPVTHAPVAVFDVPARSAPERRVTSIERLTDTTPLGSLTEQVLADLAGKSDAPAAQKAALSDAAARQKDLEATKAAVDKANEDVTTTEKDIERLREDLKAVGDRGVAPGNNPLLARVLAAEDHRAAVRKKIAALEAETEARTEAVRKTLSKLPSS